MSGWSLRRFRIIWQYESRKYASMDSSIVVQFEYSPISDQEEDDSGMAIAFVYYIGRIYAESQDVSAQVSEPVRV
jgi:hypothetical protein